MTIIGIIAAVIAVAIPLACVGFVLLYAAAQWSIAREQRRKLRERERERGEQ